MSVWPNGRRQSRRRRRPHEAQEGGQDCARFVWPLEWPVGRSGEGEWRSEETNNLPLLDRLSIVCALAAPGSGSAAAAAAAAS